MKKGMRISLTVLVVGIALFVIAFILMLSGADESIFYKFMFISVLAIFFSLISFLICWIWKI